MIRLVETDRSIQQIIEEEYQLAPNGYPKDPFIQETLQLLHDSRRRSKTVTLSDCENQDGRLYYQNKLVIPDDDKLKIKILRAVHDAPSGGHPGRGKTLELIQQEYY
jgi:hypothetical protein